MRRNGGDRSQHLLFQYKGETGDILAAFFAEDCGFAANNRQLHGLCRGCEIVEGMGVAEILAKKEGAGGLRLHVKDKAAVAPQQPCDGVENGGKIADIDEGIAREHQIRAGRRLRAHECHHLGNF
jgi:hypothetical protein